MHRWQVIFEVTLDIEKGDTPDIVRERAKEAMEILVGKDEIAHYHVLSIPKVVAEFD